MWSHPDSPEPTMKDQRNGIEMGYHKRFKYQEMRFTNIETLLYNFHYFKFQRKIYMQSRLTTWDAGRFPFHTHSFESNESPSFDVWLTVHRSSMWNKKPTRCHLVLYLFLLCKLLNMFRATLCPSSGADDLVVILPRVV